MLRHLLRERFSAPTVALLLLLAAVPMAAEAQQAGAAVDSGLREKVDVPFVLLDVTVVDRRGRTIHDLDREAFELIFDRRPVPIETLDVDCPAGATADAAPGEPRPPWRLADSAAGIRPRIVLAFDYFHMRPAVDALDQAERLVRERFLGDAEHMVVAVAEGLRIESPWTRDRELLLETFQRMRDDEELYFGAYDHLTERRVFRRFQMLVDLLEPLPGRKIIVLFTGPMDRGGFDYDPQYGELASSSGRARTAFYPVDVAGMVFGRPAWPASLARLASSTGGRLTSNTNDLTLGYARARRDLGCTYTLGFRPPPERAAEGADLQVEVRRDGARALHASRFRRREADETETGAGRGGSHGSRAVSRGGVAGPRAPRIRTVRRDDPNRASRGGRALVVAAFGPLRSRDGVARATTWDRRGSGRRIGVGPAGRIAPRTLSSCRRGPSIRDGIALGTRDRARTTAPFRRLRTYEAGRRNSQPGQGVDRIFGAHRRVWVTLPRTATRRRLVLAWRWREQA